jgi:hypothetical protein
MQRLSFIHSVGKQGQLLAVTVLFLFETIVSDHSKDETLENKKYYVGPYYEG